jgi:hypothetical protein
VQFSLTFGAINRSQISLETRAEQEPKLRQIAAAKNIWALSHSSDFLQPLDLYLFGARKRVYLNHWRKPTRPKVEVKLLRIHRAGHHGAEKITVSAAERAVVIWRDLAASGV